MEADEFRRAGKEMIDYVADYLEDIRRRPVLPDVRPGYLRELIPDTAPATAEPWDDVMKDVERVIMPGVYTFCQFFTEILVFSNTNILKHYKI